MKEIKLNSESFNEIRGSGTILLDFYADWCGPCKMIAPFISQIADERSDVKVGKVNVDEAQDLAREFDIYSIPTIVVLKDGKEVRRATGARPKSAILSLLD